MEVRPGMTGNWEENGGEPGTGRENQPRKWAAWEVPNDSDVAVNTRSNGGEGSWDEWKENQPPA
jgi:hypothetical protein